MTRNQDSTDLGEFLQQCFQQEFLESTKRLPQTVNAYEAFFQTFWSVIERHPYQPTSNDTVGQFYAEVPDHIKSFPLKQWLFRYLGYPCVLTSDHPHWSKIVVDCDYGLQPTQRGGTRLVYEAWITIPCDFFIQSLVSQVLLPVLSPIVSEYILISGENDTQSDNNSDEEE